MSRIGRATLHVWHADLDACGEDLQWLLDERELARAAQIVREPARRRWVVARGTLRALLGAHLQQDPRELRFAYGRHGKPMLEQPHGTTLHFNLSHSGSLGLYGVSSACPVGVDVETVKHRARHSREFLRAWVRHEANGKRLGIGVGNTGERFANATQNTHASGPTAWIAELDLGHEAIGAVAMAKTPFELSLRRWPT